ncbi:MAG: DUF4292 domain-containing protein [Bacteroidetes bacterium]|nr:DUF4292 domain-containing protein [Bacteroidota bacterium]MBS1649831.1 DUF4292 domain-containing protein [Bacteroidota bacterium]
MRYFLSIFVVIIFFACRPTKKIQTIQTAVEKKDTATTVIVKEVPKVDSERIVKDIMGKVLKQKINFETFNAKVAVTYESAEESQRVTAYISLKKDSILYAKIALPPVGIVAMLIVTKDSVVLAQVKGSNSKTVQYRSIAYLNELTQIPFDFSTLQDILIGNPVFIDSNIVSFKNTKNQLRVLMVGDIFKHLVTLDNNNFNLLHSKLDDVDIMRNRTCDISFGEYVPLNNYQFATYRQISVAEKSKLDIFLDFKDYSINEPLKYTFTIPKNYKHK